jgi:predicted choloylglycine hydrolase
MRTLTFRAIDEAQPGPRSAALFASRWPAYRRWFLRDGEAARPSYGTSRRMLRAHMPELEPLYDRLVHLAGGGDLQARLLALYCPTPFLSGCAQVAWTRNSPLAMVRNYDYAPALCEGTLLRSSWGETRVIAMTDCLWGVLDGMNEHGLAVSLAFGGRRVVGEGFGITLVLRYVLQTCGSVGQACDVLRRVPVHMSYNVTLLDREGVAATAWVAPDRAPRIVSSPLAVNRQGPIEWPEHAQAWETARRERTLRSCLRDPDMQVDDLRGEFLRPPLFRALGSNAWGTLYTTTYYPELGAVRCDWRGANWSLGFDQFDEAERVVRYATITEKP